MNTFAIVRNTVDIFKIDWELDFLKDEERKAYYEAFSAFDWNNNGKISHGSLIFAMRRAGLNPTEVEVHDVLNRLDDGTGVITFEEFCEVMLRKNKETEQEICYKEAFRVFYKDRPGSTSYNNFLQNKIFWKKIDLLEDDWRLLKDESGCVPAEELEFVMSNLKVSLDIGNINRYGKLKCSDRYHNIRAKHETKSDELWIESHFYNCRFNLQK